jgi:hypothetical protein
MRKAKRLELWWQLYLYVTSGSGRRKKPAITLCAFECTINKQKITEQLHTEREIARLEFASAIERRHYDADQLGREGVEHARNSPEIEFGKIHTRTKFWLTALTATYPGVCSSPGGELQAAHILGWSTELKLLRRNPKHEYLSAGSIASQVNLEHAHTFSLTPRGSESPDTTLKKHNGRRNFQKTTVRHSNTECSRFSRRLHFGTITQNVPLFPEDCSTAQ